MSREVCGICWCPYDDDTGECACEPDPTTVLPRKPLTEEEIDGMWREATIKPVLTSELVRTFARAIERAHGIGEKE